MIAMATRVEDIKKYYGKILQGKNDLKTKACCTPEDGNIQSSVRRIMAMLDKEILERFYSCGSPIPSAIEGMQILDLGCGTGKDVYILSALTGQDGFVIGVDMTEEQLEIAERHIAPQMKIFGYDKANVEFKKGYIEDLQSLGIEDNSIDIVISNCVINLSPDKEKVFKEIFRVLKPGGELYFSDVFTGRRVPDAFQNDKVLQGECLAGALYTEDFRRLLQKTGIPDYRVVSSSKINLGNPEVEKKIGMVDFYSQTIRAFKLDNLEDICEDYGQIAIYQGTITHFPHCFDLDDHHRFITGKPMLVCGNTASMLEESRYGKHFEILGDRSVHYGPFACSPAVEKKEGESYTGGACC